MNTLSELFKNFFTHKDFLPPANTIAGTLFTPLHFIVAGILLVGIIAFALALSKAKERTIRICFGVIWGVLICLEVTKILWETFSGATVRFEWGGVLPLYPCSIFMYALPFAIFGKGKLRYMGCGYVCTLGLLGAAVNFFYPANILSNYSCISFAGFHTFFYHGSMLFCVLVMLLSGYHSLGRARSVQDLFLPCIPALCVSVLAHAVNFSPVHSDYMFFKLESFFMAPIGALLPTWLTVIIVYALYAIIHVVPYLPGYLRNRKQQAEAPAAEAP